MSSEFTQKVVIKFLTAQFSWIRCLQTNSIHLKIFQLNEYREGIVKTSVLTGLFPFIPKFRKFRLVHQMKRTISVWSDRNIREWSTFGRSDGNVPFHLTKSLSSVPLFCILLNNDQTRGGLGRVCATGMYRSVGHAKFPKFQTGIFAEGKRPRIYFSNNRFINGILGVRLT